MEEEKKDWQANKKWHAIPKEIREKLEDNAFCVSCRDVTTIVEYNIELSGNDIILKGKCSRCGGRVNRLIEGE